MLEIHFTSDDLGRTRVASVPDIMWEVVNGVQLLQNREGSLIFDDWRRTVRESARHSTLGAAIRTFGALCPHAEYFPDFLTPYSPSDNLDASIETVLLTPRRQLHREISRLANDRSLPAWAAGVAAGDPATLQRLGSVIRQFHNGVIQPHAERILADLNAECAARAWVALRGGTEALLNSFAPLMHWTPPVLRMRYPVPQTLHLGGRGLLLVPSFFCWRCPVTLVDPDLTPTLVYPIDHRPGWAQPHDRESRSGSGLTALIGSTRAVLLEAVGQGRTTTQLAHLAGVSAATVTHHTTVLREANLITSRREANTMVHTTTTLGMSLLNASPKPRFTDAKGLVGVSK